MTALHRRERRECGDTQSSQKGRGRGERCLDARSHGVTVSTAPRCLQDILCASSASSAPSAVRSFPSEA
jgi:hypothetical protein